MFFDSRVYGTLKHGRKEYSSCGQHMVTNWFRDHTSHVNIYFSFCCLRFQAFAYDRSEWNQGIQKYPTVNPRTKSIGRFPLKLSYSEQLVLGLALFLVNWYKSGQSKSQNSKFDKENCVYWGLKGLKSLSKKWTF